MQNKRTFWSIRRNIRRLDSVCAMAANGEASSSPRVRSFNNTNSAKSLYKVELNCPFMVMRSQLSPICVPMSWALKRCRGADHNWHITVYFDFSC